MTEHAQANEERPHSYRTVTDNTPRNYGSDSQGRGTRGRGARTPARTRDTNNTPRESRGRGRAQGRGRGLSLQKQSMSAPAMEDEDYAKGRQNSARYNKDKRSDEDYYENTTTADSTAKGPPYKKPNYFKESSHRGPLDIKTKQFSDEYHSYSNREAYGAGAKPGKSYGRGERKYPKPAYDQYYGSASGKSSYEDKSYYKEEEQAQADGGHYDKLGFYNLPDGSFYDPDGYFFDTKGYDKTGGYYDDYGVYKAPRKQYQSRYEGEKYADQHQNKEAAEFGQKRGNFDNSADTPNYQEQKERRPYSNNYGGGNQFLDDLSSPPPKQRQPYRPGGQQRNENHTKPYQTYKAPSQGFQGEPDIPQYDRNVSQDLKITGEAYDLKGGKENHGFQEQRSHPLQFDEEEDEGDSIFIKKSASKEKPEEEKLQGAPQEYFGDSELKLDQQENQNEPMNEKEQLMATDIYQNNLILEQQRRQQAILQYYLEQQQFAIKQQQTRLIQQKQVEQQNAQILVASEQQFSVINEGLHSWQQEEQQPEYSSPPFYMNAGNQEYQQDQQYYNEDEAHNPGYDQHQEMEEQGFNPDFDYTQQATQNDYRHQQHSGFDIDAATFSRTEEDFDQDTTAVGLMANMNLEAQPFIPTCYGGPGVEDEEHQTNNNNDEPEAAMLQPYEE